MNRPSDLTQIPELKEFVEALQAEYAFAPELADDDANRILGLTGVAAHTIVRPAAPFASLAVGYLVGSGAARSWEDGIDQLTRMVRQYVGDPAPEQEASEDPQQSAPGA